MDKSQQIVNLWKSHGFVGITKLSSILKKHDIKIPNKDLSELIKQQKTAQIHKSFKKNQKVIGHIVSFAKNQNWQIDLSDMAAYSSSNKSFKYILLAVDVFSRKAFAEPLKNKSVNEVSKAFLRMINNQKPVHITSDNGAEFTNKTFSEIAQDKNIHQSFAQVGDHNALGIIDRFTRTLKDIMFKHFTDENTTNWIDYLQEAIEIYNNNEHRGIGNIAPNEADQNEQQILEMNLVKSEVNNSIKTDINVGDYVRIRIKHTFKKGYEPSYTEEIFTVVQVKKVNVVLSNGKTYKIHDLQKVEKTNMVEPTNALEKIKKVNKAKKVFKKEGLDNDNIIVGKRTRRQAQVFDSFAIPKGI